MVIPETLPIGAIDDGKTLRDVYASDQAMYPVPLPYERLQSWVAACPELSICFRDTTACDATWTACGLIIVLPLRRIYWEKLLDGRLKEVDVDAGSMFPDWHSRDGSGGELEEVEVGLHVYHVERGSTEGWEPSRATPEGPGSRRKGFAEFALEEVVRRVKNSRWRIVGMSALTATPAGKRTFEKMGFISTGYRELFVAENKARADASEKGNAQVEMICLNPGDDREIASAAAGRTVISMSEMAVKFVGIR
ncbi:hypothetical protein MFIFM68171_03607 [Madurella fahalii]|uniref:N-acetyltransferase domain-containing protein n=1 Tax=Madurella fahalii TaxID=1157608 RepID=A0ABQ0G6N4_9PEZI